MSKILFLIKILCDREPTAFIGRGPFNKNRTWYADALTMVGRSKQDSRSQYE